ncbi:MAG: hypothetical protein LLG04_16980 [Parachlamydia sp.]|nr:hypothetical protein [Parachlamydia sp.]
MTTSFSMTTGQGGTMGGPSAPLQRELETSAWTQVNKAALGIVPDSLEISFTNLGGQLWKYQSDSSRPSLQSPGSTVRTSQAQGEATEDESWKPIFDELVGKLPDEVKDEFQKDLARPFERRSQNFAQLENTLTLTAKGLSWLEGAQKPVDPESPAMDRLKQNRAMPGRALKGTVAHSKSIIGGANAFLTRVGPNHANHDALHNFAEQAATMQDDLNNLLESLKDPNAPEPTNEQLTELSDQAQTLLNDFQRLDQGKDLQILSPMMESMAAVAAALSLTPASPTLFLGLKMATMGLFSSDSASGLFGSELAALIKALQSGQGAALLKQVGMAKLQMLLMSLLGTIGGAGTLAALLSEFGIGRFPAHNEGDEIAGRRIGLQLIMTLITSSGVMKQIYAIIAQVCGGDEKAQAMLSDNMELVSTLLMALTEAKGTPENASSMLENLKPFLEGKCEKSKAFMESALAAGDLDGEKAKSVDIALLKAQMALSKDDQKGILRACSGALEQIGSTPEDLKGDLDEFKEFAQLLKQTLGAGATEQNAMITQLLRAA